MDRNYLYFLILFCVTVILLDDKWYVTLPLITIMSTLSIVNYCDITFYTFISSLIYRSTIKPTITKANTSSVSSPNSMVPIPQQSQDNIEAIGIHFLAGASNLLSNLSAIIDREVNSHNMIESSPQSQPIVDEVD